MSAEEQSIKSKALLAHPATIALLTFSATMFLNYKQKNWDTDAQIKLRNLSDERQVYAQIAGQRAVLLRIKSNIAFNMDAFAFYEASSAAITGVSLAEHKRPSSKMFSDLGSKILDDGFQKERLIERYNDQAITVTQQLFSALGEVRLLFSPDHTLDELIRRIEDLPDYDYQLPNQMEMLQQQNINAFLQGRKKKADLDLKLLYGRPLDELLTYVKKKIDNQR